LLDIMNGMEFVDVALLSLQKLLQPFISNF
jgi:hypothetical protein